MKLIIQIPCYNEERSLPITLAALPRQASGFDQVEWLVVDDGSTDRTAQVAEDHGVDHIVRLPRNRGLARAFTAGIEASLAAGAEVIVNLDADNQYEARDIPKLVAPILAGDAEIVVGSRPIDEIEEFSPIKKILQGLGSWVVRVASRTKIPDAPSGFRAMSRSAARQLNVFSDYTYTLETIIQAGQKEMAITSVPIRTNVTVRPSRLVKSIPSYIRRSILTIIRIFITYRPFEFFAVPGVLFLLVGFGLGLRFLYFFFTVEDSAGHVQSVILAALLLGLGFFLIVVGLVTDLISVNRKLLEKLENRLHRLQDAVERVEEACGARRPGDGSRTGVG